MSKTLKRAAFTFGILAMAGAIFGVGVFTGKSLDEEASYQEGKRAGIEEEFTRSQTNTIGAAVALYTLMPVFNLQEIGTGYNVGPSDNMCEAAIELVDGLYGPSQARMELMRESLGDRRSSGAIWDPVPQAIRDAIERYCE